MSFRKKNAVIRASNTLPVQKQDRALSRGTRPSPLDGRLTISTGTASLDQLLAGHCGMPLGTSLLIEETGVTDFGGTLLRYFAAQGLVHGHHVHFLGPSHVCRRELPGLADRATSKADSKSDAARSDKMRIAWRYEALGKPSPPVEDVQVESASSDDAEPFCHAFDLTKRLESSAVRGQLHGLHGRDLQGYLAESPFQLFLDDVASKLASSPPLSVHRIVVPNLLSPTVYGSAACQPHQVLQFLHRLRSILRQFPTRATALVTLPVSLYPRATGLTRWMELLSDGVIELVSLPHHASINRAPDRDGSFQGFLRVHSLPVFHERGGGLAYNCFGEDKSFKLSASSGMVIVPFSLPPVGDDDGAEQLPTATEPKMQKHSLDF